MYKTVGPVDIFIFHPFHAPQKLEGLNSFTWDPDILGLVGPTRNPPKRRSSHH